MLIILATVLVLLIFIFCGDRGLRSIITTVMQGLLLLLAINLIFHGFNPLIVTLIICTFISCVTMFYQNESDIKSKAAFLSVVIVIIILIPLIFYLANGANIEGFNSEQFEITDSNGYTRNININMLLLQMSVMIIALIGTVIDISIAITTSIYEIRRTGKSLNLENLTNAAFISSRSILNTSIHTIFYIYIAEYLTLMIQYADRFSFLELINCKSFCQEFISVSISGIGCCLIVPIASIIGSTMINNYFDKLEM